MSEFTFGGLFDSGTPYNYWQGIVAPRETWPRDEELVGDRSGLSNWGYRVRVRIEGVDPPDKRELADEDLRWVRISGSNAGSGHKRTGLSIGVTQGSKVWGIWANPAKKEDPIQIGTIPNNDQLLLPKKQPDNNGFIPFSGYTNQDLVAGYSIPAGKGKPLEGLFYPNMATLSDVTMMKEPPFPVASPSDCEKVPMTSIQKSMQELVKKIERATNQLNTWEEAAQTWIADKRNWIQEKITEASDFISLGLKDLFKNIRKFVEEKINEETKKLYELINPPDRDKAKVAKDALIELIVCLFNKMIGNLKGLVGNFLTGMLDRYINVPACAVQNFVGSLLGNTLGALSGAIDSIISKLSALIGGAFSIVGGILGILGQIAGFLACEESQECPENKEWNIFEGGKPPETFDIASIIDQAKGLAANAASLVDIDSIAQIDFANLLSDATSAANRCNVGPVFCGPPKVTFWGGGGSGARANAIVSAAGDLLGIDLITQGSGYRKPPSIDISDNCGKGGGVRARVEMEPDGGTDPNTLQPTSRVRRVVVEDTGSGFISRPDGDLGGMGRVWAPKDWTVVKREDGRWQKYPPEVQNDQIISDGSGGDDTILRENDRILIGIQDPEGIGPGGKVTPGITPGGGGSSGGGEGDTGNLPIGETYDERLSRLRGTTKIPGTGLNGETEFDSFPTLDVGTYPVILYLCDIDILNAGINYESTDKIVIEPSNGAEVVPRFGPFGVLDSIEIVKAGRGFTERPDIYIESETGYNAVLNAVLCVQRIGDDDEGLLPDDDILRNIVTVVDCVGNVTDNAFVGFINGQPYYGPFHTHMGRKMVGATHREYEGRPHPYIYDSAADSLRYFDPRFKWQNGVLIASGNPTASSDPVENSQAYVQTVSQQATGTTNAQPNPSPQMMQSQTQTQNTEGSTSTTTSSTSPTPTPTPTPSPSPPPPSSPSPPPPPPPSPPSPPPPSPPSGGGGYGY